MLLSLIMGICLIAASGFRLFVPFFVLSLASITGLFIPGESLEWIATYPALISFGAASLIEICGYYSPWIDNMLDLITTPFSIFIGIFLMSLVLTDFNPFLKWVLIIIFGGGIALNVQLLTVKARALSFVFKSGRGNFIVSTVENISSIIISILAILIPVVSLLVMTLIIIWIYVKIVKEKKETGFTN